MAIHSSIFAWRIPRTEEPGGLQSMGLKRVGHDWMTYKKCYHPSVWLICSSQLCFCSAFHSSCLEKVSLNSSSSSNVPPVNFSLTLLPKVKKKPFGFWMTSFIWLPPMADVTGIFCFFPGGTAKFGDWTTFYFSLCLQSLAPGLEHCGASKSVCGCMSSQEGCRQCVYPPQIAMCAGCSWPLQCPPYSEISPPLLGQRAGTLTLADTLWGLLVAMVEGPFCTSGLCTCPPFPMETHFSLSWALEVSHELGEGTGPCSWQGWGGTPQFHRVKCCW